MKKLFIFAFLLTLTATAQARHPVIQESLSEAESYKFEAAQTEKEAAREVAGEGFKRRHRVQRDLSAPAPTPEKTDSEVQYWQYSE